jgi:NAD(P)-dependent dehydrogenase (short-subunit alcohol dehydrogenase family)
MPFAGGGVYGMTKAAVAGLTRGLARDLEPRGITVNTGRHPHESGKRHIRRGDEEVDRAGAITLTAARSRALSPISLARTPRSPLAPA